MNQNKKIRVLIVDDSILMREAIKNILEQDISIEIVGMASDGKEGVQKALVLKPDVITMDLRMPIMTGFEAIQNIMSGLPIPIVVVSSMDSTVVMKALSIGAMDFVAISGDIDVIAKDLISKVKIASRVKALRRLSVKPYIQKVPKPPRGKAASKMIAIGVYTGGPQSLQEIFSNLPHDFRAGMLVVQHMSKGFIEGLAEWLNMTSHLHVQVARAGDIVSPGTIMIAPDDYHIRIDSEGRLTLHENADKAVLHVPSIGLMMKSVAEAFGEDAIGVIMTGMGTDGVEGIRAIKGSGGRTIAQDEHTSVVFGMNKAAIDSGSIDEVLPLGGIAKRLVELVKE